MKQIAISVTEGQYESLKNWRKQTGCSYGSVVRTLLNGFFKGD